MINNPIPEIPNVLVEKTKSQDNLFKKKNIIVLALLVLVAVLIGTIAFLIWKQNSKSVELTPIAEKQKVEEPAPVVQKPIEEEWKTYTDKEAGFALKYPASVGLNEEEGSSGISLSIAAEKLSDIPEDLPMLMGRKDALKEKSRLEKDTGDFDVNLGSLNGSTEMILARFEVCSLILDRKLTFFPNDYHVILTLSAPEALVTTEMPEFFTKDNANCGDQIVWNRDFSQDFRETLEQKQGKGIAQIWYDTFNEIVKTVRITAISKPVVMTPVTTAVPTPTYKNAKYGFGISYEKPYRVLEDKDSLSGYPKAIALVYGGGQAYDIVIEVWNSKAEYEKEYKTRLADLTVHEVNGKFITFLDMTKESNNKEIIQSFVEL